MPTIHQEMIVHLMASGVLTVANSKRKWVAPYAGELKKVSGFIETLGGGAGTSTDFQLRNATTGHDMLSTVGAFEVDSADNLLEGQVVDDIYAPFSKGDIIHLDCDAISTNPSDAHIDMTVVLFPDDL